MVENYLETKKIINIKEITISWLQDSLLNFPKIAAFEIEDHIG